MINLHTFTPYPNVKLELNKDIIDPNVISDAETVEVTWTSLLGKESKELIKIGLLSSQKFVACVQETRTDFKKKHNDLNKYPKMNEVDWE